MRLSFAVAMVPVVLALCVAAGTRANLSDGIAAPHSLSPFLRHAADGPTQVVAFNALLKRVLPQYASVFKVQCGAVRCGAGRGGAAACLSGAFASRMPRTARRYNIAARFGDTDRTAARE